MVTRIYDYNHCFIHCHRPTHIPRWQWRVSTTRTLTFPDLTELRVIARIDVASGVAWSCWLARQQAMGAADRLHARVVIEANLPT